MALINRLAACAIIAVIAAPAYAQTVDAGFETVQQEADAIRIYQDSISQPAPVTYAPVTYASDVSTTTTTSGPIYPMAKTYSSVEEAIADSRPIQVEIFDTPMPSYDSNVTTAYAPVTSTAPTYQSTQSATYSYPAETQSFTQPTGTLHVVAKGDTLFNISKRYGLKPSDIMNANGLSGSNIQLGQNLTIPAGQTATTTFVEAVPYSAPVTSASTSVIRTVTPVPGATNIYAVLPGDTLYSIATRYCTSVDALVASSGIANAGVISPGQRLTLPAGHCAR